MFDKLMVCYSVYFEKSYQPCDGWLLSEVIMSVCVIAVIVAVIRSVTSKTPR